MDIEPTFPVKRRILRKKQYDENTHDEDVRSPEEAFEYDYFNVITDMAIASLRNRFEELKRFESIFGFLLDSKRLKLLDEVNYGSVVIRFTDILGKIDVDSMIDDFASRMLDDIIFHDYRYDNLFMFMFCCCYVSVVLLSL
ncbi:UNVERIFIED_CONTAM: hypothetical protein Sradi_1514000 [Sesamum radiatum]|uniref:Uncharacterized protein n=1 Tax=Sesamum radiatum TaxID=300843 RepID=A0AAW2U8D0_SESRA